MKIKIGVWMWCLICCCSISAQTATLYGSVTDGENGEPILFGSVAFYQDGVLITGVETDFDGNYSIDSLEIGIYDVEASYIGYAKQRIESVEVIEGENTELNIAFTESIEITCCFSCHYWWKVPLIEQDNNTQGQIFTSDQLRSRGRGY